MDRQQSPSPTSIFCAAAQSDAALLAEWETHLTPLQQAGHITLWSEQHIELGTVPRMQQIHNHLDHADFIILLVSATFFADDACVALMERAIERAKTSKAYLIPLLLRPVAWRESPLASFPCVPSNNRPVTEWSNHDAAFDACVRDIRRLLGRPITAPLTHRHTHREPLQNQNRIRMLRRVRAIWIDGLLTQSLHDAVRIELCLQDRPDVLETPLQLQVQELDHAPKALPDGTTIVHVYDEAEGELLILGVPGAGKTTLLLELARTLLERAEQDEQLPLPIVFNLSSWAEKRQTLSTWMGEELQRIYQVPRKIGQAWIDADYVLPLLDGLDEVAKDARSACVGQINAYYQARLERGSNPIVVCCRSEEYDALSTRVMLQYAVSILPLTDAQINTCLEQAGEQVTGLRQALSEDAELHNLTRQPLMLNIFTLAYQGVRASDVPTGETREGMRHTIFARYVERMLRRRGQSKRWKSEQVIHWLTFLAIQMQRHDQTVFSVENLQPTWLSRKLRLLYEGCLGLFRGLIFGLLGVLIAGLQVVVSVRGLTIELTTGSVTGLAAGLIAGPAAGLVRKQVRGLDIGINPAEALAWSWKKALSGLIAGLIAGLITGLIAGLTTGLVAGLTTGLTTGLVAGLIFGLVFGLVAGLAEGLVAGLVGELVKKLDTGINPAEALTWSWKKALSGLLFGLVFGLAAGLVSGLIAGLTTVADMWRKVEEELQEFSCIKFYTV